ncbi:CaiB/BaiF CoA-transferase family protein [Cupriavidus sp. AU9028]|uniref:CaiB/BaiF CoA transferase family protein n=1 Tax=Cupriavidus sp. AU9028 TaxID=2871157 RepID=UPI001C96B787|nr:CaiB/BaiF CoA-transferase family protein [Cupriavidus sp. AU9028]MBY4897926.1 CoA transferase [Cupriavidus sp. AU9028]
MAGPLHGLKVVEMAGLGPAPFCAMMLADMGAEVVRIDRPGHRAHVMPDEVRFDVTARGRRSVAIDLKAPGGADAVLALVERADVLVEGFRPGVMERLGLGPEPCLGRNPRLVYGRMTGWGQHGPLAQAAGHDLNYIALSGALHAIGNPGEPPAVPLNYIGDFGGGAMMLAFGVVCAVLESRGSGRGQVVDAAMTDGAALLGAMMYGFHAAGSWTNRRGENLLDGGAHYYTTYLCADGKAIAVGALEPQFYQELMQRCGIDDADFADQQDRSRWPSLKARLADLFRSRTRPQWCALLEGTDACFAPVLDWDEAPAHPHNRARGTFIEIDGVLQPAPAPRFSATPPVAPRGPVRAGTDTAAVLSDWGLDDEAIARLVASGAILPAQAEREQDGRG